MLAMSTAVPYQFVSATRRTESEFWAQTALGQSLRRLNATSTAIANIRFGNTDGLPLVYNAAIGAAPSDDTALIFLHDDIWLDDFFIGHRIVEGLSQFDVLGVAGNRRLTPGQPAWAFREIKEGRFQWDDPQYLSGCVAHGAHPFGSIGVFGPTPAACELLDGVLLAARRGALNRAGVRFNTAFDFHFYDMDFCRSARQAGLRLGTWPLALTHQSGGAFGTPQWQKGYATYLSIWEKT